MDKMFELINSLNALTKAVAALTEKITKECVQRKGKAHRKLRKTEEKTMWHEGTIGVPKGDGKYTVVHYWVKAYDEGSQYGIDGGRISKLTLKISGEVVYNYDRGLDVPPQNEAAEMALAILMHEYN